MGIGRHSKTAGTLAVLAAVSLGAGACAQRADTDLVAAGRPADFQATPEYLASAIDASESAPHRFEMSMDWELMGRSLTPDGPIATGMTDGERTQLLMDLGKMFETMADEFGDEEDFDLPDELSESDLSMEFVSDESTFYIRAPFLAVMGELADVGAEFDGLPAEDLAGLFGPLEDGWGKVDLTALGELGSSELGPLVGGNQNMDPRVFLDILQEAEAVEELEADEIDGEPVTGLAASVSVQEMLDAQGMSLDDVAAQEDIPDEVLEILEDLQYDIEVWMDGDGHIRRVVMDMGAMFEQIAEEMGEDLPLGGMQFRMTVDFFDYGDESIVVEFPEDAVDITADLAEVLESLD